MNIKMVFYNLGRILKLEAFLMLLPLIISLIYKENFYLAFLIPSVVCYGVGFLLSIKKPKENRIFAKDGFAIVGLCWILLGLFGALPFVISGKLSFIDAFFETVSGFTTTGASIIPNIDPWYESAKTLLFWRSFTHWIGGMGVLVFVLAINPTSEGQNLLILKAESTGPQVGKMVSKLKTTAMILYVIYLGISLMELLLLAIDMPVFDALLHVFATAGTGGFGIRSSSLAYYSTYSQIVVGLFMIIFGINFNVFFFLIIGKIKQSLKNEELITYLGIVIVSVIAITLNLYFTASTGYNTIGLALKDSFFQVSSIITTTGFANTDFTTWPALSIVILFILMIVGGCAGSTAGGSKVSRVIILLKSIKRHLKRVTHPNSVSSVTMDGNVIEDSVFHGVLAYYALLLLFTIGALVIVATSGFDFTTNITAVVSCINNVGPGLSSLIGPAGSFADFNVISKLALIIAMLIGRLEIYPIIVLLNYKAWRNR